MERAKLEAEIKASIKECEKQIAELEHQLYAAKQRYLAKMTELSELKKELVHVHAKIEEENHEEHRSKARQILDKIREAFDSGFQNIGI
ncbi:MAG: hypothetical protein NZ455_06355 [Bacteroidia bacterium]|nr:hypothetical protein [Bacteroidia bacterium]MDW8346252.1 hypothetical protein [Bacteroidia bacterium]